jgi:hypothetical protein
MAGTGAETTACAFAARNEKQTADGIAGFTQSLSKTNKYRGESNDNCKRSYQAYTDPRDPAVAGLLACHVR